MMDNNYTICAFAEKDGRSIVELWHHCLPYAPITIEKLSQLCLAPSYDPNGVFVAQHKGVIIGFLPTLAGQDEGPTATGWLLALAIQPEHVNTGIGEKLIEAALTFLKTKGKRIIAIANCQEFSFFSHFDSRHKDSIALLEKAGFQRWRELVDIEKALIGFHMPAWVDEVEQHWRNAGISFDYCYEAYHANFLAFIRDNFGERWYRHNQRYVAQNGDPKTKILALRGQEVIGFINFAVADATGRIRQTGVLPTLRGQKIGAVLVFKSIAGMQADGATRLLILSCPLEFYQIVDGEVTKTYVQLSSIDLN